MNYKLLTTARVASSRVHHYYVILISVVQDILFITMTSPFKFMINNVQNSICHSGFGISLIVNSAILNDCWRSSKVRLPLYFSENNGFNTNKYMANPGRVLGGSTPIHATNKFQGGFNTIPGRVQHQYILPNKSRAGSWVQHQ